MFFSWQTRTINRTIEDQYSVFLDTSDQKIIRKIAKRWWSDQRSSFMNEWSHPKPVRVSLSRALEGTMKWEQFQPTGFYLWPEKIGATKKTCITSEWIDRHREIVLVETRREKQKEQTVDRVGIVATSGRIVFVITHPPIVHLSCIVSSCYQTRHSETDEWGDHPHCLTRWLTVTYLTRA